MEATQISRLGTRLKRFLSEFDDCFVRSEPRDHLRTYVRGQLSDLPRKSVEPMALGSGTPPRTLQRFLESIRWDEVRLRDRGQRIVARDHSHRQALGVVDESGHPKKGRHTATVKRQWCGNTGKVDHCVVSVHTGYVAGDFQCLLDSDLFLPKDWAHDEARRKAAHIPDEVVYRKKTDIALAQIKRAVTNGIRVAAWTFDELYGRDGEFLDGLQALGENFVAQVPANFTGWVAEPRVLQRPTPQQMHKGGRPRRYPRMARKSLPACEVRNLVRHSPAFCQQKWQRFHVKDGERGPMVWEVKASEFYRKHGDGLPGPVHVLMAARNVPAPDPIKYFVSNQPVPRRRRRTVSSNGVTLEWLLWVGFSRWPIERCFEQAKDELGLDHFEVRGWRSIHRHLYVTQLSHLFCARVHQDLREKKDGRRMPDGRASRGCRFDLGGGCGPVALGPAQAIRKSGRADRLLPAAQSASSVVTHKDDPPPLTQTRHPIRSKKVTCPG